MNPGENGDTDKRTVKKRRIFGQSSNCIFWYIRYDIIDNKITNGVL